MVASTVTESDGYFSYLRLLPGNYSARVDTAELRKKDLTAVPGSMPFTIFRSVEGTFVDNLEFVVEVKDSPIVSVIVPDKSGE